MEKTNKICINKNISFLALLVVLVFSFLIFSSNVRNTKNISSTRAVAPNLNVATSPYHQCGPTKSCPSNQFCRDYQGDTQECVSPSKFTYDVSIGKSVTKNYSGSKTYTQYDQTNPIYTYGDPTPKLDINKEYVINVSDGYPGEVWEGVTDYKVTVTGVTATAVTVLDPVNYPKNWRSKVIKFTSAGTGKITISLRRVDPSNQKLLLRDWVIPVIVGSVTISPTTSVSTKLQGILEKGLNSCYKNIKVANQIGMAGTFKAWFCPNDRAYVGSWKPVNSDNPYYCIISTEIPFCTFSSGGADFNMCVINNSVQVKSSCL